MFWNCTWRWGRSGSSYFHFAQSRFVLTPSQHFCSYSDMLIPTKTFSLIFGSRIFAHCELKIFAHVKFNVCAHKKYKIPLLLPDFSSLGILKLFGQAKKRRSSLVQLHELREIGFSFHMLHSLRRDSSRNSHKWMCAQYQKLEEKENSWRTKKEGILEKVVRG